MLEVYFYHIMNGTIEEALKTLLSSTRSRNWRALLCFKGEEKLNYIDKYLWQQEPPIIHGTYLQNYSDEQPILLNITCENLNNSEICFLLDYAIYDKNNKNNKFERIVILFDGHNLAEVEYARAQWQEFKNLEFKMHYYKQNAQNKWQLIKENVQT